MYGTETFHASLIALDRRKTITRVIWERAERLAYLFCVMVKKSLDNNLDARCDYVLVSRLDGARIPIVEQDFESLCHISLANWPEQREGAMALARMVRLRAIQLMTRLFRDCLV